MAEAIKIDTLDVELKEAVLDKVPDANFDLCLTCGTCTGGCPASEQFGMDPRKLIRMLNFGMDEEILKSDWKWVCSMCGRCQLACPMNINIPKLIYNIRARMVREKRPKGILGSCDQHIRTGSAMGAAKEDFEFTVLDVAEEIREDHPGFEDLEVTVDRVGAQMVLNQNSREPVTEPEEMGPLWKILHLVGADWTYPSVMWAGENYCMFLADDEGWRYIIEEFVLHVDNNLKSPLVVNTE
ncbi:CoB--CoM heterodisulfide reductase subunit D HdrD [Desulfotignum phosphitoxidans DSM 13687]|jgi:heterodisulfide reductase subunit C|uniref:CoB--CoM heterodisulfide reductase subunit D HdrD n=2 Tax=Desulfotignum phosphitoxidans TaxID=190898 RepID=S0G0R7_9BACT|nr:CoB--CoM heterodisulfide reductase subunit D HdrD [Desulfotignum phosphitoxidans DSM 13687]